MQRSLWTRNRRRLVDAISDVATSSETGTNQSSKEGQASSALPLTSDFHLFRNGECVVHLDSEIWRTPFSSQNLLRIDQTCLGRSGGFAPVSLPLFQGTRRQDG